MNALSLYGSADLRRRFSGDSLDSLLDGGRRRRKRRTKKHSAASLFAALGLDTARRKRRKKTSRKRRTPPRDPRTGLFLKRGAHKAKVRKRHTALLAALGLNVARRKARKAPKRRRTTRHAALDMLLFGAKRRRKVKRHSAYAAKKKRATKRYVSGEGMSAEELRILGALGLIKPTAVAKAMTEREAFIKACQASARVAKICEDGWKGQTVKKAILTIRQAAAALGAG